MKCFIQIIELTLSIESKSFDNQLNRAYIRAMKKDHSMYETDFGHVDESLMKKGISIAYHNDKKKKKIRLIVDPELVIDTDTLEKQIASYFNKDYELDDFKLSRIIFAVDIDVGNSSKVSDYIKILHNLGRVKCFSPLKREEDGEKINKDSCFALKGNSNGAEFRAYGIKSDKGVLRVEVRLNKPDAIRIYAGDTDTTTQIKVLSRKREGIFLDTFKYIIPLGDHYKKPKAEKLIWERVSDHKMRLRMLHLLVLIPEKKSLHLAQKSLNSRKFYDVMVEFAQIGVSPITISKSHDVKMLKSLYSYLED